MPLESSQVAMEAGATAESHTRSGAVTSPLYAGMSSRVTEEYPREGGHLSA